jgi:D-3-phosphoglycerate dehydrogenase
MPRSGRRARRHAEAQSSFDRRGLRFSGRAGGNRAEGQVANVPDYCVSDLTEHTMALLLTWWRRILELDRQVRTEGWGRPVKPVYRLEGKTLGILGMGRMGQALAVRARGFGLKLLGYDPYVPPTAFAAVGVESVGLEKLLRSSDIVTIHSS